jgi:acyl-CoA synthetase (AMP-forming)/AMP-acid ligase II
VLLTYVDIKMKVERELTFGELDFEARKVAGLLQSQGVKKGDKIILCYPPGLEFACAFWGALYCGAVSIPTYPPYPGTLAKDLPHFNKLVEDSGARVVLTDRKYMAASKLGTFQSYLKSKSAIGWPKNVAWHVTEGLSGSLADKAEPVELCLDDLAFFQYSSGSTSSPKAVMISFGNIKCQLKTWDSITPEDVMVSWLPSYHDMGLVGFTIVPAFTSARCVSMDPLNFIRDPSVWIQLMSKYKATHGCAPNFGFALAARKCSDKLAATLDLSNWRQAICAAEPIRKDALEGCVVRKLARATH